MDENVLAAMARWPDVPAAYGWLSLDPRGQWRLHPDGDSAAGGPGTPITHPGIARFMQRNYTGDAHGNWYVQNGPQRVYVRLDAAPFILRRADRGPGLQTHTGLAVRHVAQWWLDPGQGQLYALTDAGPARVDDRELPGILQMLRTAEGQPLIDRLEAPLPEAGQALAAPAGQGPGALLRSLGERDAAEVLGFVRQPAAGKPLR
ncbi:DUF2946 family protein [Orrella sp. JC864]|uniref:DUF2946 family protein n=1 Tax=Orrella sp. JC864 TaxID=3120298 RepID=UPI00300A5D1C